MSVFQGRSDKHDFVESTPPPTTLGKHFDPPPPRQKLREHAAVQRSLFRRIPSVEEATDHPWSGLKHVPKNEFVLAAPGQLNQERFRNGTPSTDQDTSSVEDGNEASSVLQDDNRMQEDSNESPFCVLVDLTLDDESYQTYSRGDSSMDLIGSPGGDSFVPIHDDEDSEDNLRSRRITTPRFNLKPRSRRSAGLPFMN